MDLSRLRPVYEQGGPFATVYMEGRSPSEDAEKQVRLRWQALRERLEEAGADPRAVEAVETAVQEAASGEEQTNGRVIVASGDSGVVFEEPCDAALGSGDDAHWGTLPQLGPYAREAARAIRALVVLADQEGARIRQEVIAEQHTPEVLADDEVSGGAVGGVHKPHGGGWSHKHNQRHAETNARGNAQEITAQVVRAAEAFGPRVLILAGGVQARTLIREALPTELAAILVETDRGGLDEHVSDRTSEDSLTEEVLRIAAEESATAAERRADQFHTGLAHEQAAQGSGPVGTAAEMGAVDTLLFEEGAEASREALLLKVCAGTSSLLDVLPEGTGLTDGVGALLRFSLEETTPG